jgi:hypothetical protein
MEELVIFQDVSWTSLEDIQTLRDQLQHSDLSVVTNKHSKCRQESRRPVPDVDVDRPAPPTKYVVETLFQYVDPELLAPIEKMVQRTPLGEDQFGDQEAYARMFDITTDTGQCVNVRNIVTGAIRLAVEYFRTRQIPKIVMGLQRSRDPPVARLFQRGMLVLRMHVPHVVDPWDPQQLYMKLQAFAMFSTAIDAFASFEEKIVDLTDFGFIMHPMVVNRVQRLLQQLSKYIPRTQTPFSVQRHRQTGQVKIYSTPTLCSPACIYSMVHKPSTDIDDLLCMAVHLVVHGLEYGYVANVYTGDLEQVYFPERDHVSFLEQVVEARESCEDDLDDSGFIRRHRLRLAPTSVVV